jgi:hypothetical protein
METAATRVASKRRPSALHPRIDFSEAAPFKIDGKPCKLIALTQGQFTIVDADDYEWLSAWSWTAIFDPSRRGFYAKRLARLSDGRRENVAMHNEILQTPEGMLPDHINPLNTLDNRRANLRVATRRQNAYNRRKRRTAKNQFKGVSQYGKTKRWMARLSVNGERIIIGVYDTPEAANDAVTKAFREHYGEFAQC